MDRRPLLRLAAEQTHVFHGNGNPESLRNKDSPKGWHSRGRAFEARHLFCLFSGACRPMRSRTGREARPGRYPHLSQAARRLEPPFGWVIPLPPGRYGGSSFPMLHPTFMRRSAAAPITLTFVFHVIPSTFRWYSGSSGFCLCEQAGVKVFARCRNQEFRTTRIRLENGRF